MKSWRDHLIDESWSIAKAAKRLDTDPVSFLVAVNRAGQFVGLLTDSKLRKASLRGVYESDPVEAVFKACEEQVLYKSQAVNLKSQHAKIQEQVSTTDTVTVSLDADGVPQNVQLQEDSASFVEDTPIVLMVGGVGNRLRPLTDHCPKPLLKVGNQPILQRTLESLIRQGFKRFFFSVNYKAEMIEAFFGNGSRWNVEINYLREEQRMGTAGSLRLLPPGIAHPIIVMNGDLFSETDLPIARLLRFHQAHDAKATMAVAPHKVEIPFGVVTTDGEFLTSIQEKPTHVSYINAGMYAVEPEVLALVPDQGAYDMPSLFERLIQQRSKTCAFSLREEWIDIGSFDTFESVCKRFGGTSDSLISDSNYVVPLPALPINVW